MGKIPGFIILIVLVSTIICAGCLNPAADAREWNSKGETDHVMGRYDEAVAAYDRAVSLDPSFGKAWRNRGLSLSLLNRTTEAEESFQKALSIDPNDMETLYYQALTRSHSGNYQGALESVNKSTSISPKNRDDAITLSRAWTLQGDILTDLGRMEEANQSFRKAHETMMSTI
ncbi:MAG: tetratricopeptide repeat protein [Methanoregulaceae archaeon]|jgi:tetratricopeptide (TPR) repeat protein|nr:tetratricopeptide repeat protein [Methanoregulaceae archaeon]